jgi:hypothetical protein
VQQRANAQLATTPEARLDLHAGHEAERQTDALAVSGLRVLLCSSWPMSSWLARLERVLICKQDMKQNDRRMRLQSVDYACSGAAAGQCAAGWHA